MIIITDVYFEINITFFKTRVEGKMDNMVKRVATKKNKKLLSFKEGFFFNSSTLNKENIDDDKLRNSIMVKSICLI